MAHKNTKKKSGIFRQGSALNVSLKNGRLGKTIGAEDSSKNRRKIGKNPKNRPLSLVPGTLN